MEKEDIMNKIRMLNKCETIPLHGLRRNSIYYRLISYINNSICLFISESYDDVALFIKRADEEIRILTERDLRHKDYFALCDDYMRCVSKYIINHNLFTEAGLRILPKEYQM